MISRDVDVAAKLDHIGETQSVEEAEQLGVAKAAARARWLIPLTQVAPPRLFLLSGRLEAALGDHRHGRPALFNQERQPSSAFVEWSADPAVAVA